MIAVNKKKTINKIKKKNEVTKEGYFTLSRVFYFDFGVRLFTLVKVVLQLLNNCIENIFFSLNIFFFNITKVKVKYFHSIKVNSLRSFKVNSLRSFKVNLLQTLFKTLDTFANDIFSAIWNTSQTR